MFDVKITIPEPNKEKLDRLEMLTVGLEPVRVPARWQNCAYGIHWFLIGTFDAAWSLKQQTLELEPTWHVLIREHTSLPGQ